jgi:hypothetical protein
LQHLASYVSRYNAMAYDSALRWFVHYMQWANLILYPLLMTDYTQPACTFVKFKQGDIDVGAMFNNFRAHLSEQHGLDVHVINT